MTPFEEQFIEALAEINIDDYKKTPVKMKFQQQQEYRDHLFKTCVYMLKRDKLSSIKEALHNHLQDFAINFYFNEYKNTSVLVNPRLIL